MLEEAIKNHGKPASPMTDRGSQFYANASEAKKKGASAFEKRLADLGIKQILAGLRHSQEFMINRLEKNFRKNIAQASDIQSD